jgi:RAB protein geranylgeranyltransferase component A
VIEFVTGLRRRNKYSLIQIGNTDETAVFSTCLAIIPQISKGGKQEEMKTPDYEKLRVIVMLCRTANENKLPSYDVRNIKQKETAKRIFFSMM